MPTITRSRITVASGLIASAVIGSTLLSIGSATGETDATTQTANQVAVRAAAIPTPDMLLADDDQLKSSLKVFERAPDVMPQDVAAQVASSERFGRNASLARKVSTTTGTGWVIPGKGYVCLAVPDPVDGFATSCVANHEAIKNGITVDLIGGKAAPAGKVAETTVAPKIIESDRLENLRKGKLGSPSKDGVYSRVIDKQDAVTN